MNERDERAARRSRRRTGTGEPAHAAIDRTLSYRHLENPFEPLRVFSDDQVAAIHQGALSLLENQGMKVLAEDARRRYAEGGAQVDEATLMVRFDRGLVAQSLASTPRSSRTISVASSTCAPPSA